jgi:RNA-directed DNA polymerase
MTTTPISLQDLRRRIYVMAKADKTKRFWGLHGHVVKRETLRTAYALAKRNNGASGIDGVTFAAIEAAGVDAFLAQLRDELVTRIYRPLRNRRVENPQARRQSARPGDSSDTGPSGPGGAQAHSGADVRSGLL